MPVSIFQVDKAAEGFNAPAIARGKKRLQPFRAREVKGGTCKDALAVRVNLYHSPKVVAQVELDLAALLSYPNGYQALLAFKTSPSLEYA